MIETYQHFLFVWIRRDRRLLTFLNCKCVPESEWSDLSADYETDFSFFAPFERDDSIQRIWSFKVENVWRLFWNQGLARKFRKSEWVQGFWTWCSYATGLDMIESPDTEWRSLEIEDDYAVLPNTTAISLCPRHHGQWTSKCWNEPAAVHTFGTNRKYSCYSRVDEALADSFGKSQCPKSSSTKGSK